VLQELLKLNPLSKNTVIFLLVTVNMLAFAYIRVSRDSVKKAQEMYEHPAVIRQVQFRQVRGPVRVVERIVERLGGEKVTERTILRDPVVTTKNDASASTPIAPAGTDTARYLTGGSWRLSLSEPKNGTLWGGYSFGRLDLLGGIGWKEGDQFSGHLMVVTRWGK
jgi:hypothetical protein